MFKCIFALSDGGCSVADSRNGAGVIVKVRSVRVMNKYDCFGGITSSSPTEA